MPCWRGCHKRQATTTPFPFPDVISEVSVDQQNLAERTVLKDCKLSSKLGAPANEVDCKAEHWWVCVCQSQGCKRTRTAQSRLLRSAEYAIEKTGLLLRWFIQTRKRGRPKCSSPPPGWEFIEFESYFQLFCYQ